jgi:hypothetical protein
MYNYKVPVQYPLGAVPTFPQTTNLTNYLTKEHQIEEQEKGTDIEGGGRGGGATLACIRISLCAGWDSPCR